MSEGVEAVDAYNQYAVIVWRFIPSPLAGHCRNDGRGGGAAATGRASVGESGCEAIVRWPAKQLQ